MIVLTMILKKGNPSRWIKKYMATIKEIAESLSLSSATVSRALRNDETLSITPETKARIIMAAEKLGYMTKEQKKMSNTSLHSITVVHRQQTFRNQIESSYYFSVRTGIEDACRDQKVHCYFTTIESLSDYHQKTSGIIIVGNYSKTQFDKIRAKFPNIPTAVVGIISYYPSDIDHITHSNVESIQMALDYLFDKGHSRIGYLGVRETNGTHLFGSRKQQFINLMTAKSLFHPEWVKESEHGRDRVERGYETMKLWLEQQQDLPTAIFCANDPIALGALKAIHEFGLSIPNEISLLAHDGSYPTQYTTPPLSTIDVHPFSLGYEAVKLSMERILNNRKITKTLFLHPTLIERNSVKKLN